MSKQPDQSRTPGPAREPADAQQIIQILTTEHFTLQTARSATISEANGRSALFLSAVSSGLVALAFIGQVSKMDQAFYLFSFVLFPCLIFLGVVSFVRLLETSIEDMLYAVEIARIRHYYVEVAPQLQDYFVLPIHDDLQSALLGSIPTAVTIPGVQLLLTGAGAVSVINSVLLGVLVSLSLSYARTPSIPLVMGLGAASALLSLFLHTHFQFRQWRKADGLQKSIFPAQP